MNLPRGPAQGMVLFAYGFRPFFLWGSLWSVGAMVAWLTMLEGHGHATIWLSPTVWHAHEMLFGFVTASAAGFLLTASPNWSRKPALSGRPLQALFCCWLLGRLAVATAVWLPAWLVAAADLPFLVLLAGTSGATLWHTGNRAHRVFPVLLALMAIGNALVHGEAVGLWVETARMGLYLGIDAILFFLVMVGGHIMPMFTRNALLQTEPLPPFKSVPLLEIAGVVTMTGVVLADLFALGQPMAGPFLLAASLVQGLRMSHWHSLKSLGLPLLWVLHGGYAWLVAGLLLRGVAQMTDILSVSAALHMLTVGAMGLFILGIMSRVSLAHTGRALVASPTMATAYMLVILAVPIRVFGVDLWPIWSLRLAGGLWVVAFCLFLAEFGPVLLRPRPDGQLG
ncbi:MAG: NnrS family protein [Magnetococcus sp. MYC-9]